MNRRKFLKHLGLSTLFLGTEVMSGGLLVRRSAAEGTIPTPNVGKVLVVVFLRGGCDGLNLLVPFGDAGYYDHRPSLAIAQPSPTNAESALNLDGFFGLNPSMTALHRMYQNGRLALLPAVHYPNATQSHFIGQDFIEYGTPAFSTTGWLGRYLQTKSGDVSRAAFAISETVPRSLIGAASVSATANLANMKLSASPQDQELLMNLLSSEYSRTPKTGHAYDKRLRGAGTDLLRDLAELGGVNRTTAENGAVYPTTLFGRQMQQAAGLLKARTGIELLALDLPGWDTHTNQGGAKPSGTQSLLLQQLSEGINAFFTDLGTNGNQVLLLAVTEFGRTVAENWSGGTDHGNASTWLAAGPMVRGGIHSVNGWPGLAPDKLDRGRYLAQSTDFRDVYGEVLSRFLAVNDPASLLAGYKPQSIGFL